MLHSSWSWRGWKTFGWDSQEINTSKHKGKATVFWWLLPLILQLQDVFWHSLESHCSSRGRTKMSKRTMWFSKLSHHPNCKHSLFLKELESLIWQSCRQTELSEKDWHWRKLNFCWQSYSSDVPKSVPDGAAIQRPLAELVIPAKPMLFLVGLFHKEALQGSKEVLAAEMSVFQPESIQH